MPARPAIVSSGGVVRVTSIHETVKSRIDLQIELNYQVFEPAADFVFNIHVANTPRQTLCSESLELSQAVQPRIATDPFTRTRYMRIHAMPGSLKVKYAASVDLTHSKCDPSLVEEIAVRDIPSDVLNYIYPSRYCQSDRLRALAIAEFGMLPLGYLRVQAIRDWVHGHVRFKSGSTNWSTSAIDTLNDRVGVCRDFAHLMIALCRALNIPARFTTGTDYGADPSLGPPDFQAYVEVYLGHRWYIFDPSGTAIPMGFVRFGTGRDAADVAFAMIFGNVASRPPIVSTVAIEDHNLGLVLPHHCTEALSTDDGAEAAIKGLCTRAEAFNTPFA